MTAGERKPLTKTQRLLRARSIRSGVRFFINCQEGHIRDHMRERGRDPELQGLGFLILARQELDALIEELTAEAAARERQS